MAIQHEQFIYYFQEAGLKPVESFQKRVMFGDYTLQEFNAETSDRMIFVVQKK